MNTLYHILAWVGVGLIVLGYILTHRFVKDPRKGVIITLCFALGIALHVRSMEIIVRERTVQHEAIKYGRARMVIIDEFTGKTEFQWIEENNNDAPPQQIKPTILPE